MTTVGPSGAHYILDNNTNSKHNTLSMYVCLLCCCIHQSCNMNCSDMLKMLDVNMYCDPNKSCECLSMPNHTPIGRDLQGKVSSIIRSVHRDVLSCCRQILANVIASHWNSYLFLQRCGSLTKIWQK